MAYKRYVHKKGKRHGPYYYKNVRDHAGKVRTVYLGKVTTRGKRPLEVAIVFLVALLIIISALFFIQNRNLVLSKGSAEKNKVPFEADQILIKVLVKENEYVEKELRIMNVGENDVPITVEPSGVSHLADIIDKDFTIKPGQTKIVRINFTSFNKNEGVEQAPGVYIGKAIAKSGSYQKEIPVIIEIESKNVLFDMNLNPVARDRSISQGESTTFEIRVFNLQSIESYNVGMEFLVKDTNGNTIVSEEESVVVQTQASFFKTLKIPENLKTGNYVFVAQASLGKSVGTASYLFEVESAAAKEGGFNRFLGFCRNDPLCWALSMIVLLLIFSIGAYAYFFVGVLIYEKLFGGGIPKRKLEESSQEAQPAEGKERNAIAQSFVDFVKWVNKWKEKRLKRRQDEQRARGEEYARRRKEKHKLTEKGRRELRKNILSYLHDLGLFKTEEEKKEKRRLIAEAQEKKELESRARRGGLFGKCKVLIDKGYNALNKNNLWKADRIYAKLITFYSALEEESKAEIFKDVNSFYKSLLLKKSQIKTEAQEKKKREEGDRRRTEEQRKKEAEGRKRLSKAEAEKRKERLKKSWQIAKKGGFELLRRLGFAKTDEEKKELEKRKQEDAKRRAGEKLRAEEERKKKAEEAQKLNQLRKMKAEEEAQKRGEQARKKEGAINKKEEEKEKKLDEIKLLEDSLNEKNANIAKLKEKINAEYGDIKSIEREISEKEKDVKGLQNEKSMLFKMYNDSLGSKKELSKERENKIEEWKQRYDAKITEKKQLENEAKQQYENSLKEIEDELKGLSAKERAEQEKWKKLEIKAKYKLKEKERENEISGQIKELLEEKKNIESEFKGKKQSAAKGISGKDILEKQKAINDHIRQHEGEIADLKKKIENKESLIGGHKSSIERLEEDRTKEKIELLDKKKSLGGINYLHAIFKAAESIKMNAKKPLREKEKQAKRRKKARQRRKSKRACSAFSKRKSMER